MRRLVFILSFMSIFSGFGVPSFADSSPCFDGLKNMLETISNRGEFEAPGLDFEDSFKSIYPELYRLTRDANERFELTTTLHHLKLQNARKKLFSENELNFIEAYPQYVSKKGDPILIHQYFRALARGNKEEAKAAAELILHKIKTNAVYSKYDPRWENVTPLPNVDVIPIHYQHSDFDWMAGGMINPKNSGKTSIEKLARKAKQNLNSSVATVPELLEERKIRGIFKSKATYSHHGSSGIDPETGKLNITYHGDLERGNVSRTLRHEVRHNHYHEQRSQKKSSLFDAQLHAKNDIPLSPKYQKYFSFEEVSTHSKDLIDYIRAGNREILSLYQKQPTLKANHLFDLVGLKEKTTILRDLSRSASKNFEDEIKFISWAKANPAHPINVHWDLSSQGYALSLEWSTKAKIMTTFSTEAEIAEIKSIYKQIETHPSDELTETLLQKIQDRAKESQVLAAQTEKDAERVIRLIDSYSPGAMDLTRAEYLEARDLITKPASRVTGK